MPEALIKQDTFLTAELHGMNFRKIKSLFVHQGEPGSIGLPGQPGVPGEDGAAGKKVPGH